MWRDHACCVVLAHEDLIENRPQAAGSLVNSIVLAQQRINDNRPAAAAALSSGAYLPQPLPAIKTALTYNPKDFRLAHPDWQPQRLGYQPFPFPSFTRRLVEAMHATVVDGDRGSWIGSIPRSRTRNWFTTASCERRWTGTAAPRASVFLPT